MRPALRDDPRNLVEMARRAHLYPSRTQKLSAAAATIVRECDNSAPPGSERTGRSFFFCLKTVPYVLSLLKQYLTKNLLLIY